jgi:predicted PurR-regulated permease PerM
MKLSLSMMIEQYGEQSLWATVICYAIIAVAAYKALTTIVPLVLMLLLIPFLWLVSMAASGAVPATIAAYVIIGAIVITIIVFVAKVCPIILSEIERLVKPSGSDESKDNRRF